MPRWSCGRQTVSDRLQHSRMVRSEPLWLGDGRVGQGVGRGKPEDDRVIGEEGGAAIVRLSDLVRKSVAKPQNNKPESQYFFSNDGPHQSEDSGRTEDRREAEPKDHSEVSHYYQATQQEVEHILAAASQGNSFGVGRLQQVVTGMVKALATGDELLVHALDGNNAQFDLARHMVNTTILAVKIGRGAGCRAEELPWLGLAGCLHDLGMVVVPRRILDKPEQLNDEETALVHRHPEKGFRILQSLGSEFEWLANVALQEHEREDGSGYPRGLKGSEIHEYAKIVGLADTYEALTHFRPYRPTKSAFDVVRKLFSSERTNFPDHLLKGLIHSLTMFPVGTYVRLNSSETARVAATNPSFPLRPVVEVLVGSKGERLDPPRRINLSANTLLYVTGASSATGTD
jgi:HD-GYP domain-containing protein (c-di-GMP phosphodiesterase class II)